MITVRRSRRLKKPHDGSTARFQRSIATERTRHSCSRSSSALAWSALPRRRWKPGLRRAAGKNQQERLRLSAGSGLAAKRLWFCSASFAPPTACAGSSPVDEEKAKQERISASLIRIDRRWSDELAEEEGFEPPERSHAQRFSRPPHSTTLPLLRAGDCFLHCRFKCKCSTEPQFCLIPGRPLADDERTGNTLFAIFAVCSSVGAGGTQTGHCPAHVPREGGPCQPEFRMRAKWQHRAPCRPGLWSAS